MTDTAARRWCWRCLRRRTFARRSYHHAPDVAHFDMTEWGWIGPWKDSRGHRR